MSDDPTQPRSAEEASPFEPGPANLSGCGKPAVVGCLTALILVAVGMIVLVTQSNRLLGWTMTKIKAQVLAELPDGIESEERERLARAFDSAATALASGDIDPEDLAGLQRVVAQVQATGGKLSVEQVEELTLALEEIGGGRASPQVDEPTRSAPEQEPADPGLEPATGFV